MGDPLRRIIGRSNKFETQSVALSNWVLAHRTQQD